MVVELDSRAHVSRCVLQGFLQEQASEVAGGVEVQWEWGANYFEDSLSNLRLARSSHCASD